MGIDLTSKFAFVKLVEKGGKMAAGQFLRELVEAVPSSVCLLRRRTDQLGHAGICQPSHELNHVVGPDLVPRTS